MKRVILCLCGRPASGKSTIARLLHASHRWATLETGSTVATLLKSRRVHDLTPAQQVVFRRRALALVQGAQPTPLVRALGRRLSAMQTNVVVVGVRNLSTVAGIRSLNPDDVLIVYVSTTLKNCAKRYAIRAGVARGTYLNIVRNPVEREQGALRAIADVVVDNNRTIRTLQTHVRGLVTQLARQRKEKIATPYGDRGQRDG